MVVLNEFKVQLLKDQLDVSAKRFVKLRKNSCVSNFKSRANSRLMNQCQWEAICAPCETSRWHSGDMEQNEILFLISYSLLKSPLWNCSSTRPHLFWYIMHKLSATRKGIKIPGGWSSIWTSPINIKNMTSSRLILHQVYSLK